jgi:hypothetical protein
MTDKVTLPDRAPIDEVFEEAKRMMRKIAERQHPLPANLRDALKAKAQC